ncbi:MAG: LytTR family DNA-binding domain-containing protein [Gemmatimonadaceae bacterium]
MANLQAPVGMTQKPAIVLRTLGAGASQATGAASSNAFEEWDDLPPSESILAMARIEPATRFVVRTSDRAVMIKAQNVDYVEAAGNYVRLHVQKQEYRLRTTIRTLAERLDPKCFVRIHKSTIVNLDRVREVQPWFGGDYVAILHDGRQLRVSRTFARELLRPIR